MQPAASKCLAKLIQNPESKGSSKKSSTIQHQLEGFNCHPYEVKSKKDWSWSNIEEKYINLLKNQIKITPQSATIDFKWSGILQDWGGQERVAEGKFADLGSSSHWNRALRSVSRSSRCFRLSSLVDLSKCFNSSLLTLKGKSKKGSPLLLDWLKGVLLGGPFRNFTLELDKENLWYLSWVEWRWWENDLEERVGTWIWVQLTSN